MKKNLKNPKSLLGSKIPKPPTLGNKQRRPKLNSRRHDVKLHEHLIARFKTNKEKRLREKAEYLATLPKGRFKRLLYRMHPKRVAKFIFSRDGLMFGLKGLGILVVLLVVAGFVTFAYFRKDLPKNITDLESCSQGQKTSYYDRTGEILLWRGEGDVDCEPVALENMSKYLIDAVIAAEDQTFYEHPGFDVKGTLRAAVSNVSGSESNQQGGSTLTQQYVKLVVLKDSERKVSRKIKELILSIELENTYKKEEILQAYLNEISFGSVYNGAEAASRGFFEKSAKDLTLDEAATFAAAIQAPGTYWDEDQAGLIERRNNYVLEQMVALGSVTREEADAAKQVDTLAKVVKNKSKYKDIKAPHFVLEVQRQLESEFGEKNIRSQGYKVITTLDMSVQNMAQEAINLGIAKVERGNLNNAALVAEDVPTGQVVAYVGSRDFNYPVFGEKNVAGSPRSPGSSWKPYDYAALMASSENWGAGSIMYDLDTNFSGFGPNYRPRDYDFLQPGPVSIRYALGGSRNTPAIKAMYIAGIKQTHDLAAKLGVKSGVVNCGLPCDQILSTAIGDGGEIRLDEHVHGYSTLSRNGKYIPQLFVLKILDSKGKVIRDNTKEPIAEEALNEEIAYIINDMLADTSASYFRGGGGWSGFNGYQDRVNPTAIKTGTTNNSDNGWMMGYTTQIAAGVWIGHNENKTATNFMEQMTGPIWGEFMKRYYEGKEPPPYWSRPAGVKEASHDATFYALVKGACTGVRNGNVCGWGQSDIYPSWYTPKKATNTQEKVVIDVVSNKRATECTPSRARKEITGGGIIVPEISESDPNYKNWMEPIKSRIKTGTGEAIPAEDQKDDYHSCSDIAPTVTISMPANCSSACTITADVTRGTKPLKNLYFKMDGTTMAGGALDISANSNSYDFELVPESSGNHTFTVEVVDEGLYDDFDEQVSNLIAEPFVLSNAIYNALFVKLEWDDLDGSPSYSLVSSGGGDGSITCTPAGGSKCTANIAKAIIGPSGTYTLSISSTSPTRQTNSITVSY